MNNPVNLVSIPDSDLYRDILSWFNCFCKSKSVDLTTIEFQYEENNADSASVVIEMPITEEELLNQLKKSRPKKVIFHIIVDDTKSAIMFHFAGYTLDVVND